MDLKDKEYLIRVTEYDGLDYDWIEFTQNDTNNCRLNVEMFEPVDQLVIIIDKNDNTQVVDTLTYVEGNIYTYDMPISTINVIGTHKGYLAAYGHDNDRRTLGTFKYKVKAEPSIEQIATDTEYPILTQLISSTSALNEEITVKEIERSDYYSEVVETENTRISNEETRVTEFDGIKKDFDDLKKVTIDSNVAVNLQNQINATNTSLENKVSKEDKITSSQLAIDTNANKIKLVNLADEVQQAITGNAPALSVIPNKSITMEKLGFVTVGKNLLDTNSATKGKRINYGTFTLVDDANYYVTDYIEVLENETYTCTYMYNYAYYDSNKNGISGHNPTTTGGTNTITVPTGAKYIRLSIYNTRINIMQFEKGLVATSYEKYWALIDNKTIFGIEDTLKNIDDLNNRFNNVILYNELIKNLGEFTSHRTPTSTFKGWAIPFDKSSFSENITYMSWYLSVGDKTNVPIVFELLNDSGTFVKQIYSCTIASSSKVEYNCNITVNELTDRFFIGVRTTSNDVVLMLGNAVQNTDWVFPEYVKYSLTASSSTYITSNSNSYGITDLKIGVGVGAVPKHHTHNAKDIEGLNINPNMVKLSTPTKYDLVVGDTFELFYKGILLSNNYNNYNFNITCTKGSCFKNRFVYTPLSSDVGTVNLNIKVYDDNYNLLDSKDVILNIKGKASNPATINNVLCVGDSLLVNGVSVNEFKRRITNTGGTPVGNGLTNIKMVGSCSTESGVGFEAYGGWKYENYNGNLVELQNYWVTTSSIKNTSYQKSKWKDTNNNVWVLETLESGRIKVYRDLYSTYTLPSTGSLIWVSGGDGSDNSNIVYSTVVAESGNPFWDNSTGTVDFSKYASKIGISAIDYCYVLLGWNSTFDTETKIKNNIREFVNNIRKSFTNCKITLLGLQVPSIDGLGVNYGCNWNYYEKLKFVFEYNRIIKEVITEFTNVDFINISGQFDSENNIQLGTRQVNVRNSKTEQYGINGVHPSTEGYLQIADAMYRHLNNNI